MHDDVERFLEEYPTKIPWLNEIIEVLVQYGGRAHVRTIARKLAKSHHNVVAIEETVTRTINDYCGDAADFRRPPKFNLFERVERATYQLRTYPLRPNLVDPKGVEFKDARMQQLWKWYAELVHKKRSDLGIEQTLMLFVNYWNSGIGKEMYAAFDDLRHQSTPLF
jgi:hypothetical protein